MENNKFDLIDIILLLKRKAKVVLLFTILGLLAATIFVFVRKDVYTSEAAVIVKSYMNFDRKELFGENSYFIKDAFAKENEIDKAMTILNNSDIIAFIAEETNYEKAKNISGKPLFEAIKGSYKVKRTDNSDIEIKFTDTDPELAHKAVLAALFKAEDVYRNYFEDFNRDVTSEIDFKRNTLMDSIAIVNLRITEIRKQYNIYNALAPVRGTVVTNTSNMTEANAEGVEKLQTLIKIKDNLDAANAQLTGIKAQYNSFLNKEKMSIFYRVSGPYLPTIPSNVLAIWIILGGTLAAFLFGCFWVLLNNALKNRA